MAAVRPRLRQRHLRQRSTRDRRVEAPARGRDLLRDRALPARAAVRLVPPSGGAVAFPASGSAFVARTQGASTARCSIGATEDAATGGETPPGSCRTSGRGVLIL